VEKRRKEKGKSGALETRKGIGKSLQSGGKSQSWRSNLLSKKSKRKKKQTFFIVDFFEWGGSFCNRPDQ